jgi:hypothetical protein
MVPTVLSNTIGPIYAKIVEKTTIFRFQSSPVTLKRPKMSNPSVPRMRLKKPMSLNKAAR